MPTPPPHDTPRQESVDISIEWIKRLKDYTDKVRETFDDNIKNKMAVCALLGYLESLNILIK